MHGMHRIEEIICFKELRFSNYGSREFIYNILNS